MMSNYAMRRLLRTAYIVVLRFYNSEFDQRMDDQTYEISEFPKF